MTVLRRFPARLLALAACSLIAPACADSPTAPNSFVHEAGGSVWVAVAVPEGLPEAKGWLPYLRADAPEHARVRQLADEASHARRAGELEASAALEAEALRVAAAVAHPPAVKLLGAVAALDRWGERAGERLESGSFPELEGAAARVRELRNAARADLVRGDTQSAVLRLVEAAEVARGYAPATVGLRLVAQAERRIDAEAQPSQNLRRARLLLRTAREAMAQGDETRAMKRAWYALQLIEAEEKAAAARE